MGHDDDSAHPAPPAPLPRERGGHAPHDDAIAEARARLRGIAEDQSADLIERGDALWRTQDGPDRAEAPERALFDDSPEGRLRARYLNDAARLQFRALAELRRLRREGSRGAEPSAPGVSEEGVSEEGVSEEGVEGSRGPGVERREVERRGVEGAGEEKEPQESRVEQAPAAETIPHAPPAPPPTPQAPRETNPAPLPPFRSTRPDDTRDWATEAALASHVPVSMTPRRGL